jgi:pimeloyl-ACP methyl ester carboxylesterase
MQWMRNKASKAVMDRLVQAWSEPNHFRSNINWYRALLASIYFNAGNATETSKWKAPYGSTVKRPTLLLWGLDDVCLVPETASACFELSVDESVKSQSKLITYADSGHFVQHEKSEEVTSEIFKFLKEYTDGYTKL